MNDEESNKSWDDFQKSQEYEKREGSCSQVEPKVRLKRNRGLLRDVKKLLESNPCLKAVDVFEALKSNSYGGSNPVSLETVQVTMSVLKKKAGSLVG
jgi:hypothetical protein